MSTFCFVLLDFPKRELRYLLLSAKATDYSAGLDIFSADIYVIPPMSRAKVETDLIIELPVGTCGLIAGRSGLAFKHDISVFKGPMQPI